MKILHTSDWHLGRVLHEQNLAPDQRHFLDQFIAHITTTCYDAIIIAGDIFDRSIPNEEAIALWDDFLCRYVEVCLHTPLVVIAGNHDSAARLSTAAAIIERSGIHIRGGADRITEPVPVIDAAGVCADIWCVPFLFSGALSEKTEEGERILHGQGEVLGEAFARIRAVMDPGRLNIAVSHCFAAGAELSDSERSLVGTAVQVSAGLFTGFDYVALGHIHRSQRISDRIRYSGTPLPYSFSEAGQDKVILSVALSKNAAPVILDIPMNPLRAMHDVRGVFTDLLHNPAYEYLEKSYLRIVLAEPADGTSPVLRLRQRFPHLLEFRDHENEDPGAGSAEADIDSAEGDIFEDFLAFEQRLRGDDGAPEALVKAFRSVQESLEAGAAK